MMRVQPELVSDLARALERQVEVQGEAAKRAIREYKKAILEEPAAGGIRRIESQRQVQHVVGEYVQLRRRLDELLAEMSTRSPK
jgi:hypothetical protein